MNVRVPHRLLGRAGHPHRRQLPGPVQPGQPPRIPLIRLTLSEPPLGISDGATTRPSSSRRRRRSRSAGSAAWSWTGWRATSSPRPSRCRSARATSFPASISPTTRCCRAWNFSYLETLSQAAGQPQLHPPARQRAQVPDRALPAGRAHGHDEPAGPGSTTSPAPGTRPGRGRTRLPAYVPSPTGRVTRPGPSAGCGRRASPTTTARRGSSSSASPRSSGGTSSTRSPSS